MSVYMNVWKHLFKFQSSKEWEKKWDRLLFWYLRFNESNTATAFAAVAAD